jgi:type II restriction enzyme
MKFKDLLKLYENKKLQYGNDTYKYVSQLLKEAKILHKKDWLQFPTPNKDHEQSWRAFKGKNLEKLITYIIKDEVKRLGLEVVEGNTLERTKCENLSKVLNQVKRNLSVDFGEFGFHLPDVDIIIYNQKNCKVIAVLSSKVTLRERIAQTGYWKIKLSQDPITKDIKVFFITPDEDKTLTYREPPKKGRAIVEIDTDGAYIMNEEDIQESDKVKKFDNFIIDLKNLINEKNK